jgi:hypothetical protein
MDEVSVCVCVVEEEQVKLLNPRAQLNIEYLEREEEERIECADNILSFCAYAAVGRSRSGRGRGRGKMRV